jgi:hypothetical protein
MDFFDKLVGGDKKKKKDDDKKPSMKNPFASVGKAFQGNKTFEGTGKSLGGSKPGKLIHMELAEPGPLGVKVSASVICGPQPHHLLVILPNRHSIYVID